MNELKPCPFCGGEAELRKYDVYYVGCFNVDCLIRPRIRVKKDIKIVKKEWNTRPLRVALNGGTE